MFCTGACSSPAALAVTAGAVALGTAGHGRVRRQLRPRRPPGADHPARPGPGAGRAADRHLLRRPPVGHLRRTAVRAARRARQRAAAGRRRDRRRPRRRRASRSCARTSPRSPTWSASRASSSSPATTSTSSTPGPGCGTCPRWASTCCTTSGWPIRRGTATFDLAGIDDRTAASSGVPGHGADLDAALDGRDDATPVVLLAHQPVMVEQARAAGVDLQLSGHTHGGQLWPFDYVDPARPARGGGPVPARRHPAVRHARAPATGGRRCGSAPGRRSPWWSCGRPGRDASGQRGWSASNASSMSSSSLRSPLPSAHASRPAVYADM